MEWFRMYSEFASDPKVQSMPEIMQRRLVMLLCLRCSNTLVTLQDDEVAFALRISETELAESKVLFMRKGFVNDDWEILNWDKRQFVSDSSAARVAKHRAAKKQAANPPEKEADSACNVTVTPQNRTDTEQRQSSVPSGTDADASGLTPHDAIFRLGIPWLVDNGVADRSARSLMGGAEKQLGPDGAWELMSACIRDKPLEPAAWIASSLNARIKSLNGPGGGRPNRQEALEQRNREIAERLAGETA